MRSERERGAGKEGEEKVRQDEGSGKEGWGAIEGQWLGLRPRVSCG